jgi:hypothetical protein
MGKPTAAARARAREVDRIVLELVELIGTGRYSREHLEDIAEREGVDIRRAEEWAVEAGRYLRIAPDVETYRTLNLARLDVLAKAADGKVAVSAISEQNKMLGNHAPQRVNVTVSPVAQMPVVRQVEEIDRRIEELQRARARLLQENSVPALPAGGHDGEEG